MNTKKDIRIRLEPELIEQIDDLAKKNLMSRNAFLKKIIIRTINNATILREINKFDSEILID